MQFDDAQDWERLTAWLAGPVAARADDNCALVQCEPGWSWRVRLTDHDLWLVVDGRGRGRIDGVEIDLVPGDLLHLSPGTVGAVEQDPEHRFTIAYCHYAWWDTARGVRTALPARLRTAAHLRLVNPASVQDRLVSLIRLAQDRRPLAGLERAGLLQLVLTEIYRHDSAAAGFGAAAVDARIEQVVAALRARPGVRVGLAEAAARAEMSPQYFSRVFATQVGMSFRDFCLVNRLDRARMLLAETTMTVGGIARALGYPDTYLFSRQVAQRFGCSPTQLRSRLRQATAS